MGWFFWNGTGAHVSRHATTMIHGIRSPISLWFTSSSSRCNIQGTPAASASVDAFPVQTLMLRKLDLKSEIYRAILELHTPQTVEVYDSLWILGWPYDQKSLPNLCRSCRRRHGAESIGNNPALIFDFGRWSIAIVNLWFIGDISIILQLMGFINQFIY